MHRDGQLERWRHHLRHQGRPVEPDEAGKAAELVGVVAAGIGEDAAKLGCSCRSPRHPGPMPRVDLSSSVKVSKDS